MKSEVITGWLLLDGKATFVKCRRLNDSETVVRVVVPRKHRFVYKTKKALSKSKAACLRRHIKASKHTLVQYEEALREAQRQFTSLNNLIGSLKEQLRYVK